MLWQVSDASLGNLVALILIDENDTENIDKIPRYHIVRVKTRQFEMH
jgi:hypothetical protein